MRPEIHIVGFDLRPTIDPRTDDQRRQYSGIEWRMSAMRMWLTTQQQKKAAELASVTPINSRKC